MQWHLLLFWAILGLVVSFAWRRGGSPERVAALCFTLAALFSVLLRHDWVTRYRGVEEGVLVVDAVLLMSLLLLSLYADRLWPMACAALQAITTIGHVARWVDPHASRVAYMLVGAISSFPSLIILAGGVVRHRRRLKANGVDSSWSRSLPRWLAIRLPRRSG